MLIIGAVLVPILAGIVLAAIKVDSRIRRILCVAAIVLTDILGLKAAFSDTSVTILTFTDNVRMSFTPDNLGRLVICAVLLIYTAALIYSFEYMKMEEHEEIFFCFLMISLGAMLAVCLSGNLITLYFSFELLTLTSMPLVLHEMTKAAVRAALKYLFYSIAGALLGLLAVFYVYQFSSGDGAFVMNGFLDPAKVAGNEALLLAVVMVGIIGFGTKAGLYPMHGWLPTAHPIAPAPASALLSGIIVKAGILAIMRLVYFSVGADYIRGTWVQKAWMILAMITIFMGSMMAFREKVIKKRLAYSTISQLSYMLLGLSFLSDEGIRGALLHLTGHSAAKGTLFLCAGVFIYKLGVHRVSELKAVGKKMPITLWCFTIASLSLVGIPPMGGFLSKWVIASAAIDSGIPVFMYLAPATLLVSALLTAGYLLPVVVDGFFPGHGHGEEVHYESAEPSWLMTVPMMILCAAALTYGIWGTQIAQVFGF